jgi:hypothetical protein
VTTRLAQAARAALPFLAVGAAAVVYRSVTSIYFWSDDFVCLLQTVDEGFVRFVLSVFGGHILLVRNVVLYLSHAAFGFRSEPYYTMALLTHLLNVWLLFRLLVRLTEDAPLACLGATLWGTSPLCVGALGWYAAYGHVLVATILLVVLESVVFRARTDTIGPRTVLAWSALLLAAGTCFGVGVGMALVFPAVLALLAPQALRDRRVLALVVALGPAAAGFYFGYRRIAGLVEPLSISETIVLSLGVSHTEPIFRMIGHLFGFATTGLLLGFFFRHADYLGTASTIALASVGVVLLAILVLAEWETRRQLLAFLLLAGAGYAIIAAGRANFLLISMHFTSISSAGQLRYHYAPLLALAVALCILVQRAARALRIPSAVVVAAWLVIGTWGYARSSWAIDQRPAIRAYTERALHLIDARIDLQPAGAEVRIPNYPIGQNLLGNVMRPVDFPGWAALFVLTHPENVVRGRRVLFVESDPALLAALRSPEKHRRLHDLLVPPD